MYGYIDIERYSCLYALLPPVPRSVLFIIRFSEVLDERYQYGGPYDDVMNIPLGRTAPKDIQCD